MGSQGFPDNGEKASEKFHRNHDGTVVCRDGFGIWRSGISMAFGMCAYRSP